MTRRLLRNPAEKMFHAIKDFSQGRRRNSIDPGGLAVGRACVFAMETRSINRVIS
jgi:hypothetical protein